MGPHRRLTPVLLEVQQRTVQIRSAARKGKTPAEIAEICGAPLKMVEQMLAPVADARLSDPAHLLNHVSVAPGLPPTDIQLYWVGFLSAAGRICGIGASSALIVTLGHRVREYMQTFMSDLATPQVRHELCRSNLVGWQFYVRDRYLCEVLLRWGISSEVHGDDPTVLNDLPVEFIAPFLRGYLDGNWTTPGVPRSRSHRLVLYGTEAVLAGINAMIYRGWRIAPGVVTCRPPRAELRFSQRDERGLLDHVRTYTTRSREAGL
ncbi:MAG TPA: hypothetical protein VFL28_05910 [bacterium]|nr:hypothetical protein [bacterium]